MERVIALATAATEDTRAISTAEVVANRRVLAGRVWKPFLGRVDLQRERERVS